MAVQLGALALIDGWVPGHYLYASAAAVELALLHNFCWHVNYTWADRSGRTAHLRRFLRFQLSNGAVSLAGNLALTHILVHEARVPLLLANLAAIFCCSLANFYLGNNWAFAVFRTIRVNEGFSSASISWNGIHANDRDSAETVKSSPISASNKYRIS
ncbi:MAG: GtrA family protein [Terriglobia bacterium]